MADCCADSCSSVKPPVDPRYRRVLCVDRIIRQCSDVHYRVGRGMASRLGVAAC
jgi:hypothetical protein